MKKIHLLWVWDSYALKKIFRIMRIIVLLLVLGVANMFAESSYAQKTKVSLNLTNSSVGDVLEEIESQSEFYFLYNSKLINIDRRVDVSAQEEAIYKILDDLFEGTNTGYEVYDNKIILAPSDLNQQLINVTGNVKDETGEVIPGVSIVVKGTTTGTITDIDGNYSLSNVPVGSTLTFTFIGMKTQEVIVESKTIINVTLSQENIGLDEVIAVGYGKLSKRNVTGAVQSLETEELDDIPTAQLTQKVQGKLAGVQINQTTGIPGQGMSIRVRGQASISAGNDPLYVVDGFPITGDIANINPDEIESITVLKDASSTALYGSRAANGVVMITTKQAKQGKAELSVNVYRGVQIIPEETKPEMMNAREFAQFKKEIYEENGWDVPEMFQNPEEYGKGTDWYDVVTRNAVIENYSISYSTSTDKFKSSVVGGFFNQEGVLLNSDYKRYSLRVNSEYKFNEKMKVGVNVANTITTNNTPQSDGTWYDSPSIIQGALLTSPLAPYKNADGTLPIDAGNWVSGYGTAAGPNWYRQVQEVENKGKNIGLMSTAFFEYQPVKGLTFKTSGGIDLGNSTTDYWHPSTAGGIFDPPTESDASRIYATHGSTFGYSWLWENTLTYKKSLEGGHNFEILAGTSAQSAYGEKSSFTAKGYANNDVKSFNAATTITESSDTSEGSLIEEWSLMSVLGRVNYDFNGKYILSAAFRRDGSSRFGSDNRWGTFPSASVGWVVTEENFMKNFDKMSFMKLRASYGVTGNNNIGNYTQYANMTETNNPVNGNLVNGKSMEGLNNTELGWETTTEIDLGADLGFFNDRIYLSYDYYHRTTDDLLYSVDIPISSGFYNYITNIGKLEFWGHEFALTTKNMVGNFNWTTNFNIAFSRNKAVELGTANASIYGDASITEVGKPIGQLYGLKWEGVYMNQEDYDNSPHHDGAEVGTVKFADIDGDGKVTNDSKDKTVIGSVSPDFTLGFTNSFAYKNFDLSIVCSGAFGHDIINYQERFTTNLDGAFNVYKAVDKRWRSEDNPGNGRYGKVISGTTGYERDWMSSKFVYDGSYFTIKNITLGYKFPLNARVVKSFRVYGSIQQAYVFTNYPGNNPEVSSAGGVNSGVDYTTYPVPRTFTVGLNINL